MGGLLGQAESRGGRGAVQAGGVMKEHVSADEFVDYQWAALQSDSRMIEYWEILGRSGIAKDVGEAFLTDVWLACAGGQKLPWETKHIHWDKDYYDRVLEEEALWKAIEVFREKHHFLPKWLKVDGAPEACEPKVKAAFSSRKGSFRLERARYLSMCARERFGGKPLHGCVAIAINVVLGLPDGNIKELSEDDVKRCTNN